MGIYFYYFLLILLLEIKKEQKLLAIFTISCVQNNYITQDIDLPNFRLFIFVRTTFQLTRGHYIIVDGKSFVQL